MTGFRVTIALPAKARQLSTAALYKGKIKSKNRQMHWTIPCSHCTIPVKPLNTHHAKLNYNH